MASVASGGDAKGNGSPNVGSANFVSPHGGSANGGSGTRVSGKCGGSPRGGSGGGGGGGGGGSAKQKDTPRLIAEQVLAGTGTEDHSDVTAWQRSPPPTASPADVDIQSEPIVAPKAMKKPCGLQEVNKKPAAAASGGDAPPEGRIKKRPGGLYCKPAKKPNTGEERVGKTKGKGQGNDKGTGQGRRRRTRRRRRRRRRGGRKRRRRRGGKQASGKNAEG